MLNILNIQSIKKIIGNRNNRTMLVILIIGIAIIVISGFIPDKKDEVKGESAQTAEICGEEERLGEILSEIEGVGRVSVMISYISTSEKDIARESESGRAVVSGGNVVVKREIYPQVKGVIIIAEGAENPKVKQAIKEAVTAVTGAGANRVCVYPGKK